MSKKTPYVTLSLLLLGGFLSLVLLFQFFSPVKFSSNPTLGSLFPVNNPPNPTEASVMNSVYQIVNNVSAVHSSTYAQISILAPLSVNSSFYGTVVDLQNQTIGYTFMNDSGIYKMWYCGENTNINFTDISQMYFFKIFYTTSNDGFHWTPSQAVLIPTPNASDTFMDCMPNVVKSGSTYYMYYWGMGWTFDGNIFLAKSSDGVNWTKYPSNSAPYPVLNASRGNYSSAILPLSASFINNTFYEFYVNETGLLDSSLYLATSNDGISFNVANGVHSVFSAPVPVAGSVKYLNSINTFFMVYGGDVLNKTYWSASFDGMNWLTFDPTRTLSNANKCSVLPSIMGYPNGTSDLNTIVYFSSCQNLTHWTIDASLVSIGSVNNGTFNASGFKCSILANGFNCNLNYINTLYDNSIIVFLLTDADGNVNNNVIPIAKQGIGQVGAYFLCGQNSGNFRISWKSYKQSDSYLSNPIAWSKSNETQLITCTGA